MTSQAHNKGFTIIELLIATTVFSVILLIAATTLIQVSRLYYKGIISSRTQAAARTVTDEVTRALQFSGGEFVHNTADANKSVICFGNTRFTYVKNKQVTANDPPAGNQTRHALWRDKISDVASQCNADNAPNIAEVSPGGSEGKSMLEERMRLSKFEINADAANDRVINVLIEIAYGDDDLLNTAGDGSMTCKGAVTGSQWCAVSRLSTQVFRRVE